VGASARKNRSWSRAEDTGKWRGAGADGLFVPGICLPDEIRQAAGAVDLPLNGMDWPGIQAAAELSALGARRFSAGSGIAQALWGAAREMAQGFLDSGSAGPLAQKAMHGLRGYRAAVPGQIMPATAASA
jgi:2-methylisocitrate lyase-like PEP mutase family enzyme